MDLKQKPSYEDAKQAVKVLLQFIGEDPEREGLLKTPERVIDSYKEMFSGYSQDPEKILATKFYDNINNFKDYIFLKDIYFKSFCEHHMLPITGTVGIAYVPNGSIVGISKLARIVDMFAKRLQIQENMTVQIAEAIQQYLDPIGTAVHISASHSCMTIRGVLQTNAFMNTVHFTGIFSTKNKYRKEFLSNFRKGDKKTYSTKT